MSLLKGKTRCQMGFFSSLLWLSGATECDSLQNSSGYTALATLLQRLFGQEAADGLRAPFSLGDVNELRTLFDQAGLPGAAIVTYPGTARFPSIQPWVYTEIKGWVLADRLDET